VEKTLPKHGEYAMIKSRLPVPSVVWVLYPACGIMSIGKIPFAGKFSKILSGNQFGFGNSGVIKFETFSGHSFFIAGDSTVADLLESLPMFTPSARHAIQHEKMAIIKGLSVMICLLF
jgi:hypothetical protein